MIKFHPTDTDLVDFAEGSLLPAKSLLVSAHIDLCQDCAEKASTFTENLASQAIDPLSRKNYLDASLVEMCDSIMELPLATQHINADGYLKQSLSVDGRAFMLPEALSRFSNRIGEWSHLLGKLWQAPVEIGGGHLAQFIYMEKGGGVPEHTHKGNELTLVLDGQFADGNGEYDSGDFISLNADHTHTPVAIGDEGCLVFSIIDQPLYFTTGWARLINPLSHLYFKANT